MDIYRAAAFEGPYSWHAYTESTYSVHIDEEVVNGTQYYYRLSRSIIHDGRRLSSGDGFYLSGMSDGYGGYGGYGSFFQECESQIISSVPDRRVRYGLIPDVRGFSLDQAAEMLGDDGFSVGTIIPVRTNAITEGHVLRQDAPRNSRLPRGSEITLYVATWSQE